MRWEWKERRGGKTGQGWREDRRVEGGGEEGRGEEWRSEVRRRWEEREERRVEEVEWRGGERGAGDMENR